MNEDLAYSKYGKRETLWKGSSISIYGIKNHKDDNTNKNSLEKELMKTIAVFQENLENQKVVKTAPIILERFTNEYLKKHKWKAGSSLKKVNNFFQEAVEEELKKNFQNFPAQELLREDVIKKVHEKIMQTKGYTKYRPIAKEIIAFIFGVDEEILKLDPLYMKLINILNSSDKKVELTLQKKITADSNHYHYLIGKYLEYLYEKNFKTQKGDRAEINCFLKWLCQITEFKNCNTKELDVKKITQSHLIQYKKYLLNKVSNKEIIFATYGAKLQRIKRWF